MVHAAEVSETTSGEFRKRCARFVLKVEDKNRGGEEKERIPVTMDGPGKKMY